MVALSSVLLVVGLASHAKASPTGRSTVDLDQATITQAVGYSPSETGQQCLLLTNTLSRYHITPTQTKPPGYEERNRMKGVVILISCIVIAK